MARETTGNTVRLQYSSGIYKIASWAHITNAHLVPGEGILTGLASVGQPLGRGLLLLAEMSAKGNLATGEYTAKNVEAARRHPEFVMGFVAMRRVDEREETAGGVAPGEGVRPISLFSAQLQLTPCSTRPTTSS